MFQFHQNNSQLLFHVIVSPWGAGAFSRGFTKTLARQCRAFSRALKIEKLKAPLFPSPGGAGDANDWCINIWQHGAKKNYCNSASFNMVVYTKTSIIQIEPNISPVNCCWI